MQYLRLCGVAVLLILCGCTATRPTADTDDDAAASSGPTIYGQVDVSVDRVSVD
jgi:hypothetical protein